MVETINDIIDSFSLLEDWEERYQYVLSLGKNLASYPAHLRTNIYKVQGCVSQVWLYTSRDQEIPPHLFFQGDSDSFIVKGLIYIVLSFYSGKTAENILYQPITPLLKKLHLEENLTPQRSNGLHALIQRIHEEALKDIK